MALRQRLAVRLEISLRPSAITSCSALTKSDSSSASDSGVYSANELSPESKYSSAESHQHWSNSETRCSFLELLAARDFTRASRPRAVTLFLRSFLTAMFSSGATSSVSVCSFLPSSASGSSSRDVPLGPWSR